MRLVASLALALCTSTLPTQALEPATWKQTHWERRSDGEIKSPEGTDGRVIGIPGDLDAPKARAAAGLPTFSRYLLVGGVKYTFTLVGRDVFAARAKNVTIPVKIIPVRFQFPDGTMVTARGSSTSLFAALSSGPSPEEDVSIPATA